MAALASLGFLLLVQLKLLTSICLAGVAVGLCPDEAATPAPLKSPRREARSFHDLPALRKVPPGSQTLPAGARKVLVFALCAWAAFLVARLA